MKRITISTLIFLFLLAPVLGQDNNSSLAKALDRITIPVLKSQLEFLASDHMEGRKAGEKGEMMASDYIASQLQLFGVAPGGDYAVLKSRDGLNAGQQRTYFQNFYLLRIIPGDSREVSLIRDEGAGRKKIKLENNIDFYTRAPDQNLDIEAPLVFAGYGFKSEKLKCNDFDKLNLRGKFVVKIQGFPGFAREALTLSELSDASRDAENSMQKMGALGIIEINPASNIAAMQFQGRVPYNPESIEQRPWPAPLTGTYKFPEDKGRSSLLRIYATGRLVDELIGGSGITLSDYIAKSEKAHVRPLPQINNMNLEVKFNVRTELLRVRNVIGIIEGRKKDQFIVVGAHYDHLGASGGYIWNGADDNGSGTVGVMTIAKALMDTGIKPEKSVIIALWTAEEEGLFGSRYFVRHLPFPKEQILLNLNFDMISRHVSEDNPNKVFVTYNSDYPVFRNITEQNMKKFRIEIEPEFQPSDNPPGGSDHRSFVEAGIPIFRIKPGHREEYHTPLDETRTIDWDIMQKIVRISFANLWDFLNTDW